MDSNNYKSLNNDTTFINWNKTTLSSLSRHVRLSNNTLEKEMYENRLLAFKAYLDIDNDNKININSIRYQFLNKINASSKKKKDFYVIEANRSGESMELRNYIVYLNTEDTGNVEIYNYNNGKWIKNSVLEKTNLHLDSNLKMYAVRFGLGFNQDDVIITQFVNSTVKASEYYLYSTLSDISGIEKILLLK